MFNQDKDNISPLFLTVTLAAVLTKLRRFSVEEIAKLESFSEYSNGCSLCKHTDCKTCQILQLALLKHM